MYGVSTLMAYCPTLERVQLASLKAWLMSNQHMHT